MEQDILKGLASALQIDVTELAAVLKNGNEELKGDALAKAIAEKVKEEITTATEARFKAGQSEINRKILKAAKAAGFQNTQNLLGGELVTAVIEFAKASSDDDDEPGKGAELTREKLEKNAIVREIVADKLKAAAEQIDATKAEFESFKKQAQRKERDLTLREIVEQDLEAAKIILDGPQGTDKGKRVATILQMVPDNVGIKDGKAVFLDEDGNIETDNLGKPKLFNKWLVETATPLFGVRTQDPGKGGSGAPPAGGKAAGQGQGEGDVTISFDTEDAFNKYMETETDVNRRLAARKAWASREQ